MSEQSFIAPSAQSDKRQLGKYEVISRLSTGGMSEIYLASQVGLAGFRKLVVLKTILPDISGEDDFVRMFLDEARITALFNHPNIAQVYELGIDAGTLFMAMEFVQGCTLVEMARACRAAKQPIPIGFTLAAVRDTALALHYAHNFTDPRGRKQIVIHRDVAEKNIMVTYEGTTKLLDFGIAKALGHSNHTNVGMVKGTSGYMSPEQIRGEPLDGRSDIFSLGVVLHECLTGMRLFFGKSAHEGMLAVLKEDVAPPSKSNPEVKPELDAVVLKALQRAREDRYATALELARAIEKASPGLIWHPEETAELMTKHFAQRRAETRRLLEAASYGVETTGEISINKVLATVRASGDPKQSLSLPRPVSDAPKKDTPPPPPSTPPLPPPKSSASGIRSSPSGTSPRPSGAPVRAEVATNPTGSGGRPAAPVNVPDLLDDDDEEAKTLPAKALPEELKVLREKMRAAKAGSETGPAPAISRGGNLPAVVAPSAKGASAASIARVGTGETLSVTGREKKPYDDDGPEAKTTLAHPYKAAGSRGPGAGIDPSAASTAETSGTSPTLEPVLLRPKASAPPEEKTGAEPALQPRANKNPLLVALLVVTVALTALGVLYLLDLPPFKGGGRAPAVEHSVDAPKP